MGIVEGLTEFLPISSTGHLIVLGDLLNFHSNGKVFEIAIQLGAVLAVIFEYRQRFTSVLSGLGKDRAANRFVLNLAIAFVPAALMGFLFRKQIKLYLFNPKTVAIMLVLGGLFILWVEAKSNRKSKVWMKCVRLTHLWSAAPKCARWCRGLRVRAVRLWAVCCGALSAKPRPNFLSSSPCR